MESAKLVHLLWRMTTATEMLASKMLTVYRRHALMDNVRHATQQYQHNTVTVINVQTIWTVLQRHALMDSVDLVTTLLLIISVDSLVVLQILNVHQVLA
jgi:hypothetical protein